MTRRWWLWIGLPLAACGEKPEIPASFFPQNAAGGWTLTAVRDIALSDAPDPVPRTSVERLRGATYQSGDAQLDARVYLLGSSEVGAALGSRWRPSADTVFFDHGPYFVVIKWQGADRKSVQAFVADLQKRLGGARSR